ncbi:hypothetical protein [Gilvimarinus polysaccharolyticus]|uniref:hypothetical protein n=1 Tax=Gilvimarinus polysaccharolyticus TaxID=863921 RepID=UPI00067332A6|nr:hypothetical protein [Gilvimarinus polysaccharolyticus]
MADLHITDFYRDAAKALNLIYGSFPRLVTVFIEDIAGPDSPDEFGLHSPRHQACFATLLWLAAEGYIRYQDTIRQEAIDQVTLTHKGFTLLSAQLSCHSALSEKITHINTRLGGQEPPSALVGDFSPAIDLLRAALQTRASSAIDTIMQILLNR